MPALTQRYVHGASGTPLIGETIGALLERMTAQGPDRPALAARRQGVRWTYAELNRRADDLAAGLLALGSRRASASASGRPTTASGRSPNSPPRRPA